MQREVKLHQTQKTGDKAKPAQGEKSLALANHFLKILLCQLKCWGVNLEAGIMQSLPVIRRLNAQGRCQMVNLPLFYLDTLFAAMLDETAIKLHELMPYR